MTTKKKTNAELQKELMAVKKNMAAIKARKSLLGNVLNGAAQFSRGMGTDSIFGSHDSARDYDEIFGYSKSLSYSDYRKAYDRGDIASRVIDAPVSALWSSLPKIYTKDETGEDTEFTDSWSALIIKLNLFQNIRRADKLCRLGKYSVLYLGFDDTADLSKPVSKKAKLQYVAPYSEVQALVKTYDNNIKSPRYGKPQTYSITPTLETTSSHVSTTTEGSIAQPSDVKSGKVSPQNTVHFSRVLHIIENNLESDIYGIPALEKVFNRLTDLTKVVGGSSEMFWLGARPGYAMIADSDANFNEDTAEAMEEEMENYNNELSRWLQLQGVKVESLAPQVYTPEKHFEVLVACVSSATGIPKRILIGSESGELASSMDQQNWEARIIERRSDFAEPNILRPLIEQLQSVGQLPAAEYTIIWPDFSTMSEKDKADVAYKYSIAFSNMFINSAAYIAIGPEMFARNILNFSEEDVRKYVDRSEDVKDEIKEATEKAQGTTQQKITDEDDSGFSKEEKKTEKKTGA